MFDEETNKPIQKIGDIMGNIVAPTKKRQPTHELAATVHEISKVIPLTKEYGFGYWLKLVQRSGISYTEVFGILKEVSSAGNDKTGKPYNKAGILVNKLKKLCLNKPSTHSLSQPTQQIKQKQSGKRRVSKSSNSKTAKSLELPQTATLW